jgi:uncharacterized protein YdhG (YjbR/CyaY superfamily)
MKNAATVDEYISGFPAEVQVILEKVRDTIRRAAPDAEEGIAYGMPAYRLHKKPLVYFAGFSRHIGFYALPSGHSEFSNELAQYKQGKGSVQFPLGKPVPYDLISGITRFRVKENTEKARL